MSLHQLVARFPALRVLVLGDVMLDRFIYGQVSRISPEGPIPVLAVARESAMAGGAANAACNVCSLGGRAILIGLVGDDEAGRELVRLLADEAGLHSDIVVSAARRTTVKMRLLAGRQHLLRADVDDGRTADADHAVLLGRVLHHLPGCDAIVLSDYAKGVLSPALLREVIVAARAAGKIVLADPKSPDMGRYDGVTVITPNAGEAAATAGLGVVDDDSAERAAERIFAAAPRVDGVLITRGPDGMTFGRRGNGFGHIRAAAREVNDVSGAGDTVTATLALALAAGADLAFAARAANIAAGVAVAKVGTAKVRPDEIVAADQTIRVSDSEAKIMSLPPLLERIARWRAHGERIGFTNGCFDLVHPGHVALIAAARAQCDRLIVGVNTDASVKRLKGPARPVQNEIARAIVLASLGNVDAVTLFDTDTPIDLILAVRPDVLIKGADYRLDQVVGAEFVQSYGGRVALVPLIAGQSTTQTIARLVHGSGD